MRETGDNRFLKINQHDLNVKTFCMRSSKMSTYTGFIRFQTNTKGNMLRFWHVCLAVELQWYEFWETAYSRVLYLQIPKEITICKEIHFRFSHFDQCVCACHSVKTSNKLPIFHSAMILMIGPVVRSYI